MPVLPTAPTSPAPMCSLSKEPKTQPIEYLWAALNPLPSFISTHRLRCSPLKCTLIYRAAIFPCSQSGRTPLQPPPPSHSYQENPAVHPSSPLLSPSGIPSPSDHCHKTWIHQYSVSRFLEQLPSSSVIGPSISSIKASLPRDEIPSHTLEMWTPPSYPVL